MSILNVNKISPVGGGSTITIAGIASVTNNISVGNSVTAGSFVGPIEGAVTGDVTGNLTGTASTATNAAKAYGLDSAASINTSGIITATSYRGDASQMTGAGLGTDGSANTTGIITAAQFSPTSGQIVNKNIVINGNFQINQRATSANNANGIHTTDRWAHWFGNTSVTTWTQRVQDTTPGADAPAGEGHRKYFEVVKSDAGSVAANGYSNFQYHIEASDLACSGWDHKSATSYLTLSFWVRQSAASQTFYGQIRTANGTAQKYTFAFTADSTWRKVTVTIPGNSNITMNNDNGKGATIWIAQWMGTDYTTSGHTLDAWGAYSGSDQCPDMANGYLTSTAWFRIAGVQLEVGSAATPFDHRTDGEEFIRCQRYFQAFMSKPNEGHTFATRFTTQAQGGLTYFTNMRANPSSTLKGIRIHVMGTGANETVTSHNTTIAGGSDTRSSGMWALIVSGNLVQGQACLAHGLSTSSPMGMWLDAELS